MQEVLGGTTGSIPPFIVAAILIVAGFVVGSLLETLVIRMFRKLRVDDVLVAVGAHKVVEKAGRRMDIGRFAGIFFKWFTILVFLDIAVGVLGLSAADTFLYVLVAIHLPHILIAALILFCGFVLAHRVKRAFVSFAHETRTHHAERLSSLAHAVILTLTALAALVELHIAYEVALILFGGIVAACAIAIGIMAGLGGKEAFTRYTEGPRE